MKAKDKFTAFFNLVKLGPFCEQFTNIDPKRRLYHNLKGYDTGKKPVEDIHPEDAAELERGIVKYQEHLKTL